ncbi:hypothetical protein [Algibacter sp. PT7-4]|uniref:hypothetical protein n=1 Tax=Algibacter ulvanivorans TaxID=3400999 RepID=UPI003AAE9CAA
MKNKKLHHINSSGFKSPKNYFESFDNKIFDKLNTKTPLDEIKDSGFKVPDNYFESLNQNILNNTINKNNAKVIPLINKKNIIYLSSIAAAILLLFNLSIFNNKHSFDGLDIETVESYIENENLSSYELASLFNNEIIEEDNIVDYNLNEDNIKEYLIDNADIEALLIE